MMKDSHQSTLVKKVYNEQRFDRFERQLAQAKVHLKLAIATAPPAYQAAYLNSLAVLLRLSVMQIGSNERRIATLAKEIEEMVKIALDAEHEPG